MNTSHKVYSMFENALDQTPVWTAYTSAKFIQEAVRQFSPTDPEVLDVIEVCCNVAKIRQITGKRPTYRHSQALSIVYRFSKPDKISKPISLQKHSKHN